MVEYTFTLDSVFGALSDPTRRDILNRVSRQQLSVGEIAKHYDVTFAAISKHLMVLEKAKLIIKQRRGKEQIVHIAPAAFKDANDYLEAYRLMWENRFDALDAYLKETED